MPTLTSMMKCLYCVLVLVLAGTARQSAVAQGAGDLRLENIRFEAVGDKVLIHYDLVGPVNKEYRIVVVLRRESSLAFRHTPRAVSGDVGEGRFAGKNRRIEWNLTKDFPAGLEGSDYYFEVEAELVSGGMSPLVWIGAGAAVLGGGAVFLLSGGKGEEAPLKKEGFDLPDAPGRP